MPDIFFGGCLQGFCGYAGGDEEAEDDKLRLAFIPDSEKKAFDVVRVFQQSILHANRNHVAHISGSLNLYFNESSLHSN